MFKKFETVRDLAESIADWTCWDLVPPEGQGAYGEHPPECMCRKCFVEMLEDRIKNAASLDLVIEASSRLASMQESVDRAKGRLKELDKNLDRLERLNDELGNLERLNEELGKLGRTVGRIGMRNQQEQDQDQDQG